MAANKAQVTTPKHLLSVVLLATLYSVSGSSVESDGIYAQNTAVLKKDENGWVEGNVVKFDPSKQSYEVIWSDMTIEQVDEDTANKYVNNEKDSEQIQKDEDTDPPFMGSVLSKKISGSDTEWITGNVVGFDSVKQTYEIMWSDMTVERADEATTEEYIRNEYDFNEGEIIIDEESEFFNEVVYEEEALANGEVDSFGADNVIEYMGEDTIDEYEQDYEIGTSVSSKNIDGSWENGEIVSFEEGSYIIEWDRGGSNQAFPSSGAEIDEIVQNAVSKNTDPDFEDIGNLPENFEEEKVPIVMGKNIVIAVVIIGIAGLLHVFANKHFRQKKMEEFSLSMTSESNAFIRGKTKRPETNLSVGMDGTDRSHRSIL